MRVADEVRADGTRCDCRWVDVVGRNRTQLEWVRQRFALPSRLISLSLSEHLRPTVIRVSAARFVATYFTSASPRHVFERHPVFLWLADDSIVTISPWAHRQGLLGATQGLNTTRDGVVSRVIEAAVASHGEVGWQLNNAFFGDDRGDNHIEWHRKEGRLVAFGELVDQQLQLVRALGINNRPIRQAYQQLRGLREIARYAARKLRDSGYCRVCRRNAGSRCGQKRRSSRVVGIHGGYGDLT